MLPAAVGFAHAHTEKDPPIELVINCGVIPRFVQFLQRDDHQKLQFESAWALTNIASGTQDQTEQVLHSGAVPLFIRLIDSPYQNVREQSVWALGNIAGDSASFRDDVLGFDIMGPILRLVVVIFDFGLPCHRVWSGYQCILSPICTD